MPDLTLLSGNAASLSTQDVDAVFVFILIIAGFFFGLTQGLLIYFATRYRRKKGEPPAETPYITGKQSLEVIWIVIPSLLLVAIFAYGLIIFVKMRTPIPGATEIQVTASQFQWSFKYPDGRTYPSELHLAVGKPVKLIMSSRDVIHGFFVPEYRQKQDVLPGRYTYLWLVPQRTGTFDIYCSQYCGTGHSVMRGKLTVLSQADYASWERSERQKMQAGAQSPAEKGKVLFDLNGCSGCHSTDGTVKVGPTLKGVFGSSVELADGKKVTADDDYLRESMVDPNAKVVKGFQPIMPAFKTLKDDEIAAIVAYIKSLK